MCQYAGWMGEGRQRRMLRPRKSKIDFKRRLRARINVKLSFVTSMLVVFSLAPFMAYQLLVAQEKTQGGRSETTMGHPSDQEEEQMSGSDRNSMKVNVRAASRRGAVSQDISSNNNEDTAGDEALLALQRSHKKYNNGSYSHAERSEQKDDMGRSHYSLSKKRSRTRMSLDVGRAAYHEKRRDCRVDLPWMIGDGSCNGGQYNTEECGWDGGDCLEFNELYQDCRVDVPWMIGDGSCNGGQYNTEECGWDGEDCLEFNELYQGCRVDDPWIIGDGMCDGGQYNTEQCGWDGGDCLEFNELYPDHGNLMNPRTYHNAKAQAPETDDKSFEERRHLGEGDKCDYTPNLEDSVRTSSMRTGRELINDNQNQQGVTVTSLHGGQYANEGTTLTPCRSNYETCSFGPAIVYNPSLQRSRTYCEVTVPPNATVEIEKNEHCVESLIKQNTIVVGSDNGNLGTYSRGARTQVENCDVKCMVGPMQRCVSVDGTPWSFTYSMEGPQYYGNLRHDERAPAKGFVPQKLNFWATTSFESTIPLPYFSWSEYDIQTLAVDFASSVPAASFIAKNCNSRNNREKWVAELQEFGMRVDSVSSCLHNAEPANGVRTKDKKKLMHQYLFHLAFENQNEDDYITEKLWGALRSGTLPVYLGAPNVKEHAPPHSIVVASDFEGPAAVAEHLLHLMRNRTAYEEYHAWRKKPLPHSFVQKYNFTHVHSMCRMCRWSYARIHGLGWDHATQSIIRRDGMLPLELNATNGLIDGPFQEEWLIRGVGGNGEVRLNASLEGDAERDKLSTFGTTSFENVSRTATEGDGYVELKIEVPQNYVDHDVIVRLRSPLRDNTLYHTVRSGTENVTRQHESRGDFLESARKNYPHAIIASIRDDRHRFTVIGGRGLEMGSPGNGIIEIVLPTTKAKPFAVTKDMVVIRVVIEKMSPFETNVFEPSSFCKQMLDELQYPVQLFRAT